MKIINENFLEWLDDEKDLTTDSNNYLQRFNLLKIHEKREEFEEILHFLSQISKYHYRNPFFFNKIQFFLSFYQEQILNFFTNYEIFKIFKGSKRILLFLVKNKILTLDERIVKVLSSPKYLKYKYLEYFSIEIKNDQNIFNSIDFDVFEKNRESGENEKYICQLIREDLIKEFVIYVNKTNLNLTKTVINSTIFETNSFLIKNNPNLIEYSAFFGSIQIFKYLYFNKVELKPSLWIFAIHGRNPELIHFLEENKIKPYDETYNKCLIESIKCHHIELFQYFKNNFFQKNKNFDVFAQSLKYCNFLCFPYKLDNDEKCFYYFCKYNYITLVRIFLNASNVNVNMKIISNKNSFFNNDVLF